MKKQTNKGITLIALVITIIVLLILAAVSIATLTGDNGILTQVGNSKTETEKGAAKERTQVEVLGSYGNDGKLDYTQLKNNLNHITGITGVPDTITESSFPLTVTVDRYEVMIDQDGNVVSLPIPPLQAGDKATINVKDNYTDGTDTATIPRGFTVSGLEEETTIDDGLVIYLIPDGTTVDWKNETEVEKAKATYDQFVWVPIPNAIAEDMNGDNVINETDIDLMIAAGKYPMAIATDNTNYRGILYDFNLKDGEVEISDRAWSADSTSYREPAYLEDSNYTDKSDYNTVGITRDSLQSEFNAMVAKVATNKGFWVGRYETSNMNGGSSTKDNSYDATQQINIVKGATEGVSGNNINWYRMYAQQKNYAKLTLGSTSTTSSMIWGSQWDQIMIWMKDVNNTAQSSKYVVSSIGMGNFGDINGVDDGWSSTSSPAPTGYQETYQVKKIYDLAGNVYDWTLEALFSNLRVLRGGVYNTTNSADTRATYRSNNSPVDANAYLGSRSSLY